MSTQNSLLTDLETVMSRGSAERRGEAAAHIAELFVHSAAQFGAEQVALFDDIFIRLVAEIELAARAALADKLASIPNAPPRTIRVLAFDDAAIVAGPVLALSEGLDDASLVDNALTKSQSHLLAISKRAKLVDAVTDVLVERGDRDVVLSVAGNIGACFSERGYSGLVKRAANDDDLATCVGMRPEIPRHHFLKILAFASDTVRARLETANPQAAGEIQRVVAEVTDRIKSRIRVEERDYGPALTLVQQLKRRGTLDESELENVAIQGKFEEVVALLSVMCDLPVGVVDRAMLQERAELLLIFARSLNLSWSTTKAILLLRAGDRAVPEIEFEQYLASFERLKPETALQVVRHHRSRAVH